jgi:large subunit ribosomal protein L3
MTTGFWGKKIGMTQVFVNDKVVPVTVIDTASWIVIGLRTQERDGYSAVRVGRVKSRYKAEDFDAQWLKDLTRYFSLVREVRLDADAESVEIGKQLSTADSIKEGDNVNVTGTSKGCGFAGVVRRHGFGGPPASHGSTMGNRPGSIGFITSQGKVIKGKKLPGRMGGKRTQVDNLKVVQINPEEQIVLVKGAVPGKSGSFVFVRKA